MKKPFILSSQERENALIMFRSTMALEGNQASRETALAAILCAARLCADIGASTREAKKAFNLELDRAKFAKEKDQE